jgi:protein-L-isoaspartate(D-aspartate) O-methyltransferase
MDDDRFASLRKEMVESQLIARGILEPRILNIFSKIPRHKFVRNEDREYAYSDFPLPIGHGQTISQPYIVALMTEMLDIHSNHKVLEIGTGSGYQAAILGSIATEVHSIERIEELAKTAQITLGNLKYFNVHIHIGDGSCGWVGDAPYDRIIVTAAAPSVPEPLLSQLKIGGRLVIPIGDRSIQYLEKWERREKRYIHERNLAVCFVPLHGKFGWRL